LVLRRGYKQVVTEALYETGAIRSYEEPYDFYMATQPLYSRPCKLCKRRIPPDEPDLEVRIREKRSKWRGKWYAHICLQCLKELGVLRERVGE